VSPAGAARIVLAVGVATLIVAFAVGGSRPVLRLAGSNGVGPGEFVAVVGAGETVCQAASQLPAGTGSLRMVIGTYGTPGPELRTAVRTEGGRRVLRPGRLRAGWTQGTVDVPLGGVTTADRSDVRLCVANRGATRIAVAGTRTSRADAARVAGRPASGRVRLAYVEARRTSAWSLSDRIWSRMPFGRGLWDGAAPWLALVLVALAAGAALRGLLLSVGTRP